MQLSDLLVYVTVSGVLLGGTALLLQQGQRAHAIGEGRVEVQQSVRFARARMTAEIRGAGFAPNGGTFAAIAIAEPTRLAIQHDLNGDGLIRGAGETITYLLRGTTLRRDAGGGAQPVLDGVSELRFTYLDVDRRPPATPDAIRSIVISIAATPTQAPGSASLGVVGRATTEVRLRNR